MKICRCVCGEQAEMKCVRHHEIYLVKCTQTVCWHGRTCRTEAEAAHQWNSVMTVIVGLDIIFGNIDDSEEVACDDCARAGPLRFCGKHMPF